MAEVHVFAGPTLHGAAWPEGLGRCKFSFLPPARRGDLDRCVELGPAGTIVLVDAVFHYALPPSHAEIRRAIDAGWSVWGVASMGAIRACELRSLGMRGFGRIYDAYCAYPEMADDEVALLHAVDPPFVPLSEPLVHIREALATACEREMVGADLAQEIATELSALWFGDRTIELLRARLAAKAGGATARAVTDPPGGFIVYRVKQHDLKAALPAIAAQIEEE